MTWAVPGDPSSGSGDYGTSASRTASFATEGTYTLDLSVTDKDGGSANDSMTLTVLNRPPDCAAAVAGPDVVSWTPAHRMVDVIVHGVTDAEGDALTTTITSIRQDEEVGGTGSGAFSPDGSGVGTSTASVRSERDGDGNGRVYHIGFSTTDGHGGSCDGTVTLAVPRDQSGSSAVDDGPLYDSTATTTSRSAGGRLSGV